MDRHGTHPTWPVLLGASAGMALGLWLDARAGGVAMLASLCQAEPRGLPETLALHWDLLPRMHVGMLAGALAAVAAFRGQGCALPAMMAASLSCLAWMLVGMAAGTMAGASLAGSAASPAGMVSAMLVGMAWGMAASAALGWLAGRPALAWSR